MKVERTVESFVNRVLNSAKNTIVKKERVQTEKLEIQEIEQIHITTSSLDVEVKNHDNNYIDIELKTYEDGPELKINQENDVLEITALKPKQEQTFFGLFPSTRMIISVPPRVADAWDFRTGSGDISFSRLMMDKLTINTGSGDVTLADLEARDMRVRCASGDVKATNIHVENCDVNSTSGDMVLRNLKGSTLSTKVTSGDILLADLQVENLTVQAASGDVRMKGTEFTKGTILSRSGDVDGNHITTDMLTVNTSSGDIKLSNFSGSINGVVLSGDLSLSVIDKCAVNLSANSGDIVVDLTEEIGLNTELEITCDIEDVKLQIPMELTKDSKRLTGTTGKGENKIRIKSDSGDVSLSMKETVQA